MSVTVIVNAFAVNWCDLGHQLSLLSSTAWRVRPLGWCQYMYDTDNHSLRWRFLRETQTATGYVTVRIQKIGWYALWVSRFSNANGCLNNPAEERPISDEYPSVAVVVDDTAATAVVRVLGELDYSSSSQLEAALEQTQSAGQREVVVDFTSCRYIDSTVLTVLVRASKKNGDALRVVIPLGSHIRRIFAITNLDRMIRIDETLDA
jgi:anti-anti-sigma factor